MSFAHHTDSPVPPYMPMQQQVNEGQFLISTLRTTLDPRDGDMRS
jgi:hypothetical protein